MKSLVVSWRGHMGELAEDFRIMKEERKKKERQARTFKS